jgi:hypothetical protein
VSLPFCLWASLFTLLAVLGAVKGDWGVCAFGVLVVLGCVVGEVRS